MSQRREKVNKEFSVSLNVKVRLESFSNHNGFFEGQIAKAIEEFEDEILSELMYKLEGDYSTGNMLTTVDFVDYKVTPNT